MAERTLLIDRGNTRLKWVEALDGVIVEESVGRGNFGAFVKGCRSEAFRPPSRVLFSSVAGEEAANELAEFCTAEWSIRAQRLQTKERSETVINGYAEPDQLGVDRWLAIVGAVAHHGRPVVVWDLGTASTLDAVDEAGRHIGGMIYPGPATMLRALVRDTKLEVPADLSDAGIGPGRATSGCIRNGTLAAQIGALNQFLRSTWDTGQVKPKLVLTGGGAREILPLLDFPCIHDPWLVFRGMLAR